MATKTIFEPFFTVVKIQNSETAHLQALAELAGLIFDIDDFDSFNERALQLFHIQARHVPIYRNMLRIMDIQPSRVTVADHIPFLPIRFFRTHTVCVEGCTAKLLFESSGTTNSIRSRHLVHDPGLYRKSAVGWFRQIYCRSGSPVILALLPGYSDRPGASLVTMLQWLMDSFPHPLNGFYHGNTDRLISIMHQLEKEGRRYVLWGVTHALLQLASDHTMTIHHGTIIETGGMKGHGIEPIREEVHDKLRASFGNVNIHSEYGMTELLSQAYAPDGKNFQNPPWMKISIHRTDDRSVRCPPGKSGAIHIMDLANAYSCAFLATDDIGNMNHRGSFKVLGRLDNSDLRGCNMMI